MDFFTAIKTCFRKYSDVKGRAQRSEFWFFVLFYVLIYVAAAIVDPSEILGAIISLVLFLPTIAVSIRRLHDIDKSGWWYLIALIPLVNLIWVIYFGTKKGSVGANRFGEDPLNGTAVQISHTPTIER